MSSFSEEAGVMSPFAETVSSVEERELALDETVVESIHTPDPPMATDYDVAEIEGEECVRRALEQLR